MYEYNQVLPVIHLGEGEEAPLWEVALGPDCLLDQEEAEVADSGVCAMVGEGAALVLALGLNLLFDFD